MLGSPRSPRTLNLSPAASLRQDPVTGAFVNEFGHSVLPVTEKRSDIDVNELPVDDLPDGFEPRVRVSAEDPSSSFNFEHDHLKVKEAKEREAAVAKQAAISAVQAAGGSGPGVGSERTSRRGVPKSLALNRGTAIQSPTAGAGTAYQTEAYIVNKERP